MSVKWIPSIAPEPLTTRGRHHDRTEDINAAYPAELLQQYADGTLIPYAPVGSPNYTEDRIVGKVRALGSLFEGVAGFENTHVSFTLLKFCVDVRKNNYVLRVTPVACTEAGAILFDELLENTLRSIVYGVLDSEAFNKVQLPARVGLNDDAVFCLDGIRSVERMME